MPAVTVAVPVRNEVETIGSTLAAICAQTYHDIEVLVTDGMSTDGTVETVLNWAEKDERIRLIPNPGHTIPRALNLALDQAKGQWLIRVDAHSTIAMDYVERIVGLLEEGWGGVGGLKVAVGAEPNGPVIAAVLSSPFGVGHSVYHYADRPTETDHIPFGAYPVALARTLGGWDEKLIANEDFEFDVRLRQAGHQLFLDPSIVVEWRCRDRILDFARQYLRYGRGKADVAALHPRELRLRHLLPPALVASLAAGALMWPVDGRIPAAVVVVYAVGLLILSVPIGRTLDDWRSRLRVPAALAAMHIGWGLGFWRGTLRLLRHGGRVPALDATSVQQWDSPSWSVNSSGRHSGE